MQVSGLIAVSDGSGGQGRCGILARQRGSRDRNRIFGQIRSYRDPVATSHTARCRSHIVTRTLQPAASQYPRMTRALRPLPYCPAGQVNVDNSPGTIVTLVPRPVRASMTWRVMLDVCPL